MSLIDARSRTIAGTAWSVGAASPVSRDVPDEPTVDVGDRAILAWLVLHDGSLAPQGQYDDEVPADPGYRTFRWLRAPGTCVVVAVEFLTPWRGRERPPWREGSGPISFGPEDLFAITYVVAAR